ncbi:MAG: hypothetical protein CVV16_01475 [Gammaproteobacteria bacterium HGW-Gammaproteobacteria-6]|nr:MAG: hypothetical protein CVV16_01475 [Gammaproteobacteria bacterium HGW-Gammaproteobacteria-6]
MKSHYLLATACVAALLFSAPTFASPDRHRDYRQHESRHHHQHRESRHHRHEPRAHHRGHEQHRGHGGRYHNQRQGYRSPPPVHVIRQHLYPHRHHVSRGHARPPHVIIVQGRPLPRGYGRRLGHAHARHLPHYAGYEWHSSGRDLILVAVTTGIVYAILDNVL